MHFSIFSLKVCMICYLGTYIIARGLSFGTISHGIGTAQAMKEGDIQGATSGVAIGLTGIFTSLMIPWLLPLLVN